ncbi:hypothetical protein Patl1_35560 [Pistacia atlantica]|nr:hypothetical protein Patl1_35560 [Pistacia atlantica]
MFMYRSIKGCCTRHSIDRSRNTTKIRIPWEVLRGNISKGGVCVAGDALHPMTPTLVKVGVHFGRRTKERTGEDEEKFKKIETGLKRYAKERRWRSFELINMAYVVGLIQQSDGMIVNFVREKILSVFLAGLLKKRADFNCGKLSVS